MATGPSRLNGPRAGDRALITIGVRCGRMTLIRTRGSAMRPHLGRALAAEGLDRRQVAGRAETQRLCEAAGLPQGLRVTTHIADRDKVTDRYQTDKIHLLFNNAGISGGGSMVTNSRDKWERTFNICVYNCTRTISANACKAPMRDVVADLFGTSACANNGQKPTQAVA